MACNTVVLTGKEQYLAQIEKIANSSLLHGSESLCKLLRYLARNAVDHPGAHPKEYQIATEVFGRSSDFDPQMDSTVRVQVGRLRQKLHEYYSSEGAEDAILVDLPKGSYALGLHHRGPAPLQKELESHVVAPVAVVAPSPRNWAIAVSVREVEKCVAGGFVAVELVGLAVARELRVDLVDIRRRRVGVVQAEEPDRRRGDVFGEVERGGPVTPRFHDVAAVEDAGGAPRCGPRAGEQIGDAPAHAEAEDGQVSDARLLHRAQVRDRGVGVSDDLVVA